MKNLIENLEYKLWSMIGGEDVRPKVFTMNEAKKFFYEVADNNPKVVSCKLLVVPKNGKFEIVQLMLDKNGDALTSSQGFYVGRKIIASEINDAVREFLNGENERIMQV